MRGSLDYREGLLCVLIENGIEPKEWYPVHADGGGGGPDAAWADRSLALIPQEGIYVDEEGNVFQLLNKGETKPIEVEHLPGREKTELEELLEASLNGKKPHGPKRRFEKGAAKKSKQRT